MHLAQVARGEETPERTLTTVLFTDLVASTDRAAATGDRAWAELLQSHHALVRRELDRYRGRELDNAGDGFLAAFGRTGTGHHVRVRDHRRSPLPRP